ncbi:hypothetical protein TSUD_247720 [Trifolium subterraneum]|uniref:Uncharacterized protein n=1 Tax=Trifolium subterraneum TaxID=3900 RepID=A0A2Z6NZR3_TRISU|nr:hypothetical protein TSUD_247720 [Trifolium subterraneum]
MEYAGLAIIRGRSGDRQGSNSGRHDRRGGRGYVCEVELAKEAVPLGGGVIGSVRDNNFSDRGVQLNSSLLCVSGYGRIETANPIISVCWKERRWLGVSAAFLGGQIEHLRSFKGLVSVGKDVSEKLGAIWFSIVSSMWKVRNGMIFKSDGFNWEKVVEEYKGLFLLAGLARFWRRSCIASVKSSSGYGPAVMIFCVAEPDVLYQLSWLISSCVLAGHFLLYRMCLVNKMHPFLKQTHFGLLFLLVATDEEHDFEEKNEVESDDNDSWHSEELRNPISSDDEEGDVSEKLVFYQFNEANGHNSVVIG